jgi:hypothetical protein
VNIGALARTFTAGNWTYNAGVYSFPMPTGSLAVGEYTISIMAILDSVYYNTAAGVLPFNVRARMIEWVVFPSLGTPVGFIANTSFRLIDLDDPLFRYLFTSVLSAVNTTDYKAMGWGILADGVTFWVTIDTSDHLVYPAGSAHTFTMQVSGTGIDSGKTKDITLNIVDYNILASFDSIPVEVGWNQTAGIPFLFSITPDDFGKIWMGNQDAATMSNIHVNITVKWLNGTRQPVDIIMQRPVNGTLLELGYYKVVLRALEEFNANETASYALEFNVTAWYNRAGTFIPLYNSISIVKEVNITKIDTDSLLGAANEDGTKKSVG